MYAEPWSQINGPTAQTMSMSGQRCHTAGKVTVGLVESNGSIQQAALVLGVQYICFYWNRYFLRLSVQISLYEDKMTRLKQEQKRLQQLNSLNEDEVKTLLHCVITVSYTHLTLPTKRIV